MRHLSFCLSFSRYKILPSRTKLSKNYAKKCMFDLFWIMFGVFFSIKFLTWKSCLCKGWLPVTNLMNFCKTSKQKPCCAFFREARKFATKFIRIGVTPPLSPSNYREKKPQRNFLDRKWPPPPPPLRKFSKNSSNLGQIVIP